VGLAEKLLPGILTDYSRGKLFVPYLRDLCFRDLCQRHHCVSGIFLLATKAQIHEFSRRQEFKMQDISINPPETLQNKLTNYAAIIDSGKN
jgi:hypothetical protein